MTAKQLWSDTKSRYQSISNNTTYHRSMVVAICLLAFSLVVNYFAALYALERASNPVADIILSNIPVYDVDWIFMWGPFLFWLVLSIFVLMRPNKIPFMLKSIATFVIIRSIFISLTHIGPFPDHISLSDYNINWIANLFHIDPTLTFVFSSGADLFFSAHTGLPFLMALTFWRIVWVRLFCLFTSAFFAVIVLLGHLHYSIDVMSAFFITYTISHIIKYIFDEDHKMSLEIEPQNG